MKKYSLRQACQDYVTQSRTYKTYVAFWGREWGSMDVRSIDVPMLREWRARQLEKWAPSTVNVALAILSAVLEKAIDGKRMQGNPVRELGWLRVRNERKRFFSPDEVEEISAECDPDLRDYLVFAVHSGLRIGEVLAIDWDDWRPGRGGHAGTLYVRPQKTDEERYIPLHPSAENILRARKKTRQRRPFPGKYADLYRRLKPILERAGIFQGCFHLARHTFASWMASEDVSIYKLQKMLGHRSLKQTERYAKLQVADLVTTLSALDRAKAK